MTNASPSAERACLLELDPEAADVLGPEAAESIGRRPLMAVLRVPAGAWRLPAAAVPDGTVALAVLEGLLLRETAEPGGASLSGPGDLVEPWGARPELRWTAWRPLRLAIVGRPLLSALRAWPDVLGRLLGRALSQEARDLDALAVLGRHGDDQRLLGQLGRLTARWDEPGAERVTVAQALDPDLLGRLAGVPAGRGAAIVQRLGERGIVVRRRDGSWLVRGAAGGPRDRAAARDTMVAAFASARDAYAAAVTASAALSRELGGR